MKCKYVIKETGQQCRKNAITGREFCASHRGKVPRGAEHWNYQGKGRSKYVPTYLADKYEEAMADPELIEYRDRIALLQSRRKAIAEAGESELLWARAKSAFRDLERANKDNDQDGIRASLDELHNLIYRGHADAIRWREVYEVVEREGRMVEREHKRLAQLEQMMSMEHVLAFVGMIMNVVTDAVKDAATLRAISRSIDALVAQRTGQANSGH